MPPLISYVSESLFPELSNKIIKYKNAWQTRRPHTNVRYIIILSFLSRKNKTLGYLPTGYLLVARGKKLTLQ